MIIRKLSPKDAGVVSELIKRVFIKCVAPDWSEKAVKDCLAEQSPEKILQRSKERTQLVAILDNKIVGMIEGRDNCRISRLFIDKNYQRRGIATELTKRLEKLFKRKGAKKLLVHSSIHAMKFYSSFEFKKATGLIRTKGMVYQPMIKYLK